MAVTKDWQWDTISIKTCTGLSSDTKPTTNIPAGSRFLETDTGETYVYNGSAWVEIYGAKVGKSYREVMTELGYSWVENFLIDVGNDLTGDIDTTYTALSLIDVHTRTGSNTLAVVNSTGFTGGMYTVYWIECTKAGAMGAAEFKWRTRGYLGGAGAWGDYTTGVVTAADNDLGNNVVINFTGITSVVGDIYLAHGKPSWHTPADGYNSYLTSFGVRMFDSNRAKKIGYARMSKNTWEVWEMLDNTYVATVWSTPLIIHGDGTKQYKMEFREVTKADIEYVYFEMKGWDEPE